MAVTLFAAKKNFFSLSSEYVVSLFKKEEAFGQVVQIRREGSMTKLKNNSGSAAREIKSLFSLLFAGKSLVKIVFCCWRTKTKKVESEKELKENIFAYNALKTCWPFNIFSNIQN